MDGKRYLGLALFTVIGIICTLVWIFVSAKAGLVTIGLIFIGLFLNLIITIAVNTFNGLPIINGDLFWRIFLIVAGSVCIGIGVML